MVWSFSNRRIWLWAFVLLPALALLVTPIRTKALGAFEIIKEEGVLGVFLRIQDSFSEDVPDVRWASTSPASEGADIAALETLARTLAGDGTKAFLVVRHGRIIQEHYGPGRGANRLQPIAAMGKAATASMVLLVAMQDSRLALNSPAWRYIPAWQNDPQKRGITIRHLATHSSGLEDLDFRLDQKGWKKEYLDHPERRFRMVVDEIPVLFEPGSWFQYSGVGFYALAYALAAALEGAPTSGLKGILKHRIMRPLRIPDRDWSISYDESQRTGGMDLYALGSGGAYTARALARVGQLVVNHGRWENQQLIDSALVASLVRYGGSPAVRVSNADDPAMGIGFWVNCDRFFPSLPEDAALGVGDKQQILLVVPSMNLVMVRLGDRMTEEIQGRGQWDVLETKLFSPLMRSFEAVGKDSHPIAAYQP